MIIKKPKQLVTVECEVASAVFVKTSNQKNIMKKAKNLSWFAGEIREVYVPSIEPDQELQSVTCSKDINTYWKNALTQYARKVWDQGTIELYECFYVFFLNRANKIIGWSQISKGGMAGTVADPKMIFRRALAAGASGIILAHNHPSGSLKASEADINLTEKLKNAGVLLEIQVLDHIILTSNKYFSFADEGYM